MRRIENVLSIEQKITVGIKDIFIVIDLCLKIEVTLIEEISIALALGRKIDTKAILKKMLDTNRSLLIRQTNWLLSDSIVVLPASLSFSDL